MAVQATITLDRLVCIAESDLRGKSHSEPYVWPYLGIVNGGQYTSTPTVATVPEARRIIRNEMKANESALLPITGNNRLSASFDDSQTIRHLILIVGLWEADEAPVGAVKAGYQAFLEGLDAQFRERIGELAIADADRQKVIVDEIKKRVSGKVRDAMKSSLSWTEALAAWWGSLNMDDFIAAGFWHFSDLTPTPFTLDFPGVSGDPKVIPTLAGGGRAPSYRLQEFPVHYMLDCSLAVSDPRRVHGPLDGTVRERVMR